MAAHAEMGADAHTQILRGPRTLTFKERVGSVRNAAPVGSIFEAPLCKLVRREVFLVKSGDFTQGEGNR